MGESLEVMVARTDEGAKLPTRGSEHAAGWDLYALEEYVVPFRKSVKLRTGLRVAIPVDMKDKSELDHHWVPRA